jgi:hypothetical protein
MLHIGWSGACLGFKNAIMVLGDNNSSIPITVKYQNRAVCYLLPKHKVLDLVHHMIV